MKRLILILSLLCIVLSSCQNQTKEKKSETYEKPKIQKLPLDAIGITYTNHLYFQLEFDSIQGNYLFDTGADRLYYDSIFYNGNLFKHKNIGFGRLPGVGVKKQ